MLKKIFITIAIIGFILMLGIAGKSDYETDTGIQLMTQFELHIRLLIASNMLLVGSLGVRACDVREYHKQRYKALMRDTRHMRMSYVRR